MSSNGNSSHEMIETLLKHRGEKYGPHQQQHLLAYRMWQLIDNYSAEQKFKFKQPSSRVELKMILLKITRLLASPDKLDHYDDIRGYLSLMEDSERDTGG